MIILATVWKQMHSLHSGIQAEEAAVMWDIAIFVVKVKQKVEPCEALKAFTRNWHMTVIHISLLGQVTWLTFMQVEQEFQPFHKEGPGEQVAMSISTIAVSHITFL